MGRYDTLSLIVSGLKPYISVYYAQYHINGNPIFNHHTPVIPTLNFLFINNNQKKNDIKTTH
jgi:hypothetical protein